MNGIPDIVNAILAALNRPAQASPDGKAASFMLVPQGHGLVRLPPELAAPNRPVAAVTVTTVADFVAYVKRHAITPAVFVAHGSDGNGVRAEAVLDYHVGRDGAWGGHRVALELEVSDEFAPWVANNMQLIEQVKFAEFIEDHAADVSKPEPASLRDLALALEGRTDAKWQAKRDTRTGGGILHFEEETTTGNVDVPRDIELLVPIMQGEQPRPVRVLLGYRINQARVGFVWRIPALDRTLADARRDVRKVIASELPEVQVVEGVLESMGQPDKPVKVHEQPHLR
jgi:uncharacterized protein YfdQ (DUF2303 family)